MRLHPPFLRLHISVWKTVIDLLNKNASKVK